MKYAIIASGSEGNCTLIEDDQGQAILIDAGLSMRRIGQGLAQVKRDLSCISALLISHEHADHFRGAAVLSRRLDLPIYTSPGTLTLIRRCFPGNDRLFSMNGEIVSFGDLQVRAFRVSHDAYETLGFIVQEGERKLAIATDLGHVDLPTLSYLQDCDAIVLEANHDLDMLMSGPYPWDLKRRIKSHTGHLSNQQAAEALLKVVSPRLGRVVLAHLSQENNNPDLALKTVCRILHEAGHTHVNVIVADQYAPTELYQI
jgi:phosphoribosyl 1,2-cyclic phosphodiesterase